MQHDDGIMSGLTSNRDVERILRPALSGSLKEAESINQ